MQPAISTRFDADTLARLDELAKNTDSSRSELIKEAVSHYLDYISWYTSEIQIGLDDIEAGRVVSHEEMKRRIRGLDINVD